MHELRQAENEATTVSFAEKMILSQSFKVLFSDGMTLVEDTASYLDGKGREDAKTLSRSAALAYASESMRLTTRLMQMTSWLLLQRAVNEGELTQDEANAEHRKVAMKVQDVTQTETVIDVLPQDLRLLVERSMRMQVRIMKLDAVASSGAAPERIPDNPVRAQLDFLTDAMAAHRAG